MENYSEETQALLQRIDAMKLEIDALRPIKPEQEARIFQKFRLDWNYNSNSIEGNKLTYGETAAFLMEGLTAKGKPLKDHLDIKGHNEAIDFLLALQRKDSELTEADIRALHTMILVEPYQNEAQTAEGHPTTKTIRLGEYKSSPNHVKTATGAIHYYASVEDTPIMMRELIEWYRENRDTMHPLVLSTLFHHRFVGIHPFDDGNGRMTRLLSNLILMRSGFPPLIIRQDEKSEYYGVLSQADVGVTEPLIQHFAERLIRSLETYIKGAKGEDISEPTDIDKEIALFVAGFSEEEIKKEAISEDNFVTALMQSFPPLLYAFSKQEGKINSLFFDNIIKVRFVVKNLKDDSDTAWSSISELSSLPASDIWTYWMHNNTFLERIIKYYRDNYTVNRMLRIVVLSEHSAFKANAAMETVNGYIVLDFYRGEYKIHNAVNEFYITKYYKDKIKDEEVTEFISSYFKTLMESITNSYRNATKAKE
ncbi:Fic family protein [Hymenobacter psychrotolerans]|uniref:Fic/DOC family protein n=1 Tax=Hymenobacter psychrotolerans DSM 18569 TaxID=1121959 RepID=A0A1M6Z6I3_9BACT|nr:Fic family protein [Hymenobacter psychrotolerans]SHL26040.1 Fic/DOC family protein [Hymenobacter psychrotolerans DSM 18569]